MPMIRLMLPPSVARLVDAEAAALCLSRRDYVRALVAAAVRGRPANSPDSGAEERAKEGDDD